MRYIISLFHLCSSQSIANTESINCYLNLPSVNHFNYCFCNRIHGNNGHVKSCVSGVCIVTSIRTFHLDNLHIGQTIEKCFEIDAIQNYSIVINVPIRFKIDDCFFLMKKKSDIPFSKAAYGQQQREGKGNRHQIPSSLTWQRRALGDNPRTQLNVALLLRCR